MRWSLSSHHLELKIWRDYINKVLKGQYPKISDKFSIDIQTIVRILLQVNPKKRPNCGDILDHAIVKKKSKELFPSEDVDSNSDNDTYQNSLLKTIYFPK